MRRQIAIDRMSSELNNRPGGILGWKTPPEVVTANAALIA